MNGINILRTGISIIAVSLLIGHLLWPQLKVDAISLGLLIVALLPWFSSLIESAKFPGGWEIKFRDIQAAGDKIAQIASITEASAVKPILSEAYERDPNLALVAFRIEIEKRLRLLAELENISPHMPVTKILHSLQDKEVLRQSVFSGLQEIVMAGNQAAHGARVEPAIADWVVSFGPHILGALDDILEDKETL